MDLRLKLEVKNELKENALIRAIDDGEVCRCKLTTNSLEVKRDRKDNRFLSSIDGVKMIISIQGGCIILFGNLQKQFRSPWGGAFYVYKVVEDPTCDFETTIGVDANITFCNNPTPNDTMNNVLDQIYDHEDFVFKISQFEDFMEIFTFYKKISDELNNSASYKILNKSKSYYFIPVHEKRLYNNEGELYDEYKTFQSVENSNGILIGYELETYEYDVLSNALKESIKEVIDIEVAYKSDFLKNIRKMSENLYVSNEEEINQKSLRKLMQLSLVNILNDKKTISLTVEAPSKDEFKFLNLYDMGQKIKIESIDNSLRLIKQGNSGSAIQLISYLIGDALIPNVDKTDKIKTKKYLEGLNESQKQAFLKAVDGSPVTLIKGPPGTGKTHVINAITQYITKELNEKVVISSQTHVAIDNVLDKLMENHDIVVPRRITNRRNPYSDSEIDKTLYKTWGRKFQDHSKLASNKRFAKKIMEDLANFKGDKRFKFSDSIKQKDYSVIGATTTTSAIAGKKGTELLKEYQWLIIDEVSKCPITEVLRYFPYIDKIIMVGDDYQLAPLLEFRKEEVEHLDSYDEDLYEILEEVYQKSVFADTIDKARKSGRLVELDVNYRSVPHVLQAYNIFYDFMLKSERLNVNPSKVEFKKELDYLNQKDVAFVYVKGGKEVTDERTRSRYNIEELNATKLVLKKLLEHTKNPDKVSIAAIFPYGSQIKLFTKENRELINKAKKVFKSFDVDTVDAFQGKESDIVLLNTVITDSSKRNFMSDFRRINVSMSRAKDKLIIFGNMHVLSRLDMQINDGSKRKYFKDIIEDIRRTGLMIDYSNGGGIQVESTNKTKTKIKKAK